MRNFHLLEDKWPFSTCTAWLPHLNENAEQVNMRIASINVAIIKMSYAHTIQLRQ